MKDNKFRKKTDNNNMDSGMSIVVKTVTRLSVGIIMLYGINLTFRGHLGPGIGFAGGGIVMLAFINLILAYGKDIIQRGLWKRRALLASIAGLACFVLLGRTGLIPDGFFSGVRLMAEHIPGGYEFAVLTGNITVAIAVGGSLAAIFIALLFMYSDEVK